MVPAASETSWHTHQTQGNSESVAVIRENNEDIAYFVIKRIVRKHVIRQVIFPNKT